MRIILPSSDKMSSVQDAPEPEGLPVYLGQTEKILAWMRKQSRKTLLTLWGGSKGIAKENLERLNHMDLRQGLTPAIYSYIGGVYRYMSVPLFEEKEIAYLQEHLRILSGFYGVLKPLDGVTPYRLPLGSKVKIGRSRDLFDFWGGRLYDEVRDESGVIISLVSEAYERCMRRYLEENDRYITIRFLELTSEGEAKGRAVMTRMAVGQMVRFMAEKKIEDPDKLKRFNYMGYRFNKKKSGDNHFVFERIGESN